MSHTSNYLLYMADLKKKQYFKNMVNNSRGNPRTLWQLVNKNLDRKQSNPLPDYTYDLAELASDFNSYFTDKIDFIRSHMDDTSVLDSSGGHNENTCLWQGRAQDF